ncbi:MAG: hypothetical protein WCK16_04180 [Candidatus Moraniibacteriota bacterium]
MKKIITTISILLTVIFLAGCGQQSVSQIQPTTLAPVAQKPVQQPVIQPTDDALNSKITSFEQKWKKEGLINWQKEDFIFAGMSIIAPKNLPKSFVISVDPKDIKSSGTSILGNPISGVIYFGELGKVGNLGGSCSIVKSDLPQGVSLEQWIRNTWNNVIAKNDCNGKNQPLTERTMRGETWNEVCKKGAYIENKLSEGLIRWDTAYIGSPPIISAVVGNNVVSFECGQDISETVNELIEDIAGTFLVTPLVNETASWQTYTSANSSFDLKYPSEYKYFENNTYGVEPDFVIRKTDDKEGVYAFGVQITTNFLGGDPDKFKNPDVWEKEQGKLGNNYTKTTISGQVAYIPKYASEKIDEYIVFMKNGSVYDMYNISTNINDPVGEKILSTFNFTSQILKNLEAVTYDAVNIKTKGIWDKKLEIGIIHESQKAAKGFWWAKDRWDWIAWQKDDGNWAVLVSVDGFNCKELDGVPNQYVNFFKDVTYQFGKKYCYF